MNHTRFPKEVFLPDWACRDNQVIKDDHVQYIAQVFLHSCPRLRRNLTFFYVFFVCIWLGYSIKDGSLNKIITYILKKVFLFTLNLMYSAPES